MFPTVVAVYQQTLLLWLPAEGLALKWKDGKCKLFRGLRVVRMTRCKQDHGLQRVQMKTDHLVATIQVVTLPEPLERAFPFISALSR